jgi:hypothetical protein
MMEICSVGSFSSAMSLGQTANAVQLSVQKKAIDIEEQSAMQLIAGVTESAPQNPSNLGNAVDTFV